jgi:hypothetical protein
MFEIYDHREHVITQNTVCEAELKKSVSEEEHEEFLSENFITCEQYLTGRTEPF